MEITSSKFVISSPDYTMCPKVNLPEFAFIGRSNVGKSSLINMLTNKKLLAQTSSTPGKTRLINHFLINEKIHFVDLPGYGYAKISKEKKKGFQKLITDYIVQRENLLSLLVLIDSRLPLQKIDEEFIGWLGSNQIPFVIVYTKCDKLGKTALAKSIKQIEDTLLETWEELPERFLTSSEKRTGRSELLGYIGRTSKLASLKK